MKLVSKQIKVVTNFWVEDYNEKEKEFFLSLGFNERIVMMFEPKGYLEFKGSGVFGFWSDIELKRICDAVKAYFNLKQIKVEDNHIY